MRRTEPNLCEDRTDYELFGEQYLGLALRSLYEDTLSEPLPEIFRILLEQLAVEEQLRSEARG